LCNFLGVLVPTAVQSTITNDKNDKTMRKTILTLLMMLTLALTVAAGPVIKASPAKGKANVEFKGDTMVVTDGDKSVTVSGLPMQRVRDKINNALDDTLTGGSGTTVEIGGHHGDLSPDDVKEISDQWASVVKQMTISGSFCLLGLVALVLLFRFLNRRNKYRVIEKAIENNYPLNELSLNDTRRSAIYVQQPVITAPPVVSGAPVQQADQVPVGTPLKGQTAANPIVMTDMVNWRAMMPAVKWIGWGTLLVLFSVAHRLSVDRRGRVQGLYPLQGAEDVARGLEARPADAAPRAHA